MSAAETPATTSGSSQTLDETGFLQIATRGRTRRLAGLAVADVEHQTGILKAHPVRSRENTYLCQIFTSDQFSTVTDRDCSIDHLLVERPAGWQVQVPRHSVFKVEQRESNATGLCSVDWRILDNALDFWPFALAEGRELVVITTEEDLVWIESLNWHKDSDHCGLRSFVNKQHVDLPLMVLIIDEEAGADCGKGANEDFTLTLDILEDDILDIPEALGEVTVFDLAIFAELGISLVPCVVSMPIRSGNSAAMFPETKLVDIRAWHSIFAAGLIGSRA